MGGADRTDASVRDALHGIDPIGRATLRGGHVIDRTRQTAQRLTAGRLYVYIERLRGVRLSKGAGPKILRV